MPGYSPQRQGERGFSLLLIVFSATAFWQSYAISGFTGLSTPGVFPMLASATMLVSAVCLLLQNIDRRNIPGSSQTSAASVLPLRIVVMLMLITGYLFAMPLIGFILSSAVFLFLSFSYLWRKPILVSLLVTGGSVAFVYLIFRKLFQVVLPKGSLLQGMF